MGKLVSFCLIFLSLGATATEFQFVVPVDVEENPRGAILIEAPKEVIRKEMKKRRARGLASQKKAKQGQRLSKPPKAPQ